MRNFEAKVSSTEKLGNIRAAYPNFFFFFFEKILVGRVSS